MNTDFSTQWGPGGFGMLMTKGLVDELIYSEKRNELIVVKRVGRRRET